MIFSEGLIAGYDLERETIFPRILISEELKEFIKVHIDQIQEEQKYDPWKGISQSMESHFKKDDDEKYFLNYLVVLLLMDHTGMRHQFASAHKIAIERWVEEGKQLEIDEENRKKHEWAVRYHNRACKEFFPRESSLLLKER